MKKTTLFKSLLLAAALCVGANAWADGNKRLIDAQNYELIEETDWSQVGNGSSTIINDASYGKYSKSNYTSGAGNNRSCYKSILTTNQGTGKTTSSLSVSGYNVEFDINLTPGSNNDRTQNQFIAYTANSITTNSTYSGTDYIFSLSTTKNNTTWYVNDLSNNSNSLVLTSDHWYHVKLVVSATSVDYVISDRSTKATITNGSGSKSVTSMPTLKGLYCLLGYNVGVLKFDNLEVYDYVDEDVAEAPTFTMTGFDGTSRIFTISCNATETIHYTVNGGATQDGASAGASVIVTVPAGQELVAWTTSGTATSSNTSYTVVGGTPALTAPTVALTDIGTGYSKTYTVSNLTQTISEGAYSYNFEPTSIFYATSASATSGTNIADNKFILSAEGTYYVIVSATGATSANTEVDNTVKYILSANYDFTNAAILTDVWTDASDTEKWVNGGEAEAYKENSVTDVTSSTDLFDGFTVTEAGKRHNKMHWHSGKGVQFVNSGGNFTIGLTTVPEDAIIRNTYYQNGSNNYVLGNTITIGRYNVTSEKQGLVAIDVYTPDPVAIAIADCKTYETSSAFATAVAAGSFSTAAEVYAFHTAWQIETGTVTDGVRDITKVIRNAAVSDAAATDWTGGSAISISQEYTGAPDGYFIDVNSTTINAQQWLYGVPAGVYTIKAATRSIATTDKGYLFVNKNGEGDIATVNINHDGNTGGALGNGWSWSEVTFTLTETSNLLIGFYVPTLETGQWAGCDDWHLYKVESVSATVGANGYTTFASPYALDLTDTNRPEGLKAYKATLTGTTLSFTKLNQTVPAGTGLLLLGETNGGTYNIPVVASGDDVTNALVGVTSDTPLQSTENGTYYFVMKKATSSSDALTFAPLSTSTEVTIPAGKAYVALDTSTGARSLTVAFDDEATGIKSIDGEGIMVNGFYNLNGQRVENPAKGLYIVNGKKVIMK